MKKKKVYGIYLYIALERAFQLVWFMRLKPFVMSLELIASTAIYLATPNTIKIISSWYRDLLIFEIN